MRHDAEDLVFKRIRAALGRIADDMPKTVPPMVAEPLVRRVHIDIESDDGEQFNVVDRVPRAPGGRSFLMMSQEPWSRHRRSLLGARTDRQPWPVTRHPQWMRLPNLQRVPS